MTNNLENEIFPMLKTKEEIQIWLNKHHINNYIIHDNLTVDVGESISLFKKSLKYIPIQFGVVHGNFQCSENNLVTLKGCPKIVYGTFECASNQLNSLKYAPEYVEYSFTCANNKITSLEYLPKIGKAIACHKNQITSLKGAPQKVDGHFACDNNLLTSLEFCPEEVRSISCSNNFIEHLNFFPQLIHESIDISNNKLKSLKGFKQKKIKNIECYNNQLTSLEFCPKEVEKLNAINNKLTNLNFIPKKSSSLYLSDNPLITFENNIFKTKTLTLECVSHNILNYINLENIEAEELILGYKKSFHLIPSHCINKTDEDFDSIRINFKKYKEHLKVEYEKSLLEDSIFNNKQGKKLKL